MIHDLNIIHNENSDNEPDSSNQNLEDNSYSKQKLNNEELSQIIDKILEEITYLINQLINILLIMKKNML